VCVCHKVRCERKRELLFCFAQQLIFCFLGGRVSKSRPTSVNRSLKNIGVQLRFFGHWTTFSRDGEGGTEAQS
jgi:GMP synthase-like glutamine amidotransferase